VVVEVTAEDIAGGTRECAGACPVALALNRHVKEASVMCINMYWRDEAREYHRAPTPDHVRDWFERFDAGRKVEPFSFTVELS
jgi:hypothetical protein